ncbi:hypothetical protein AVEN_4713-1 [Araneus ventricosus]|uniref:Integrase zinc-binding domain-containing protein n=1 Tax=Araneus ventricosus TaxID=182803 RepID=A0A4Y2PKE0_ARAVE|nr:hypothetical protein AVEN_4713-1 [Araneus ventricosus]
MDSSNQSLNTVTDSSLLVGDITKRADPIRMKSQFKMMPDAAMMPQNYFGNNVKIGEKFPFQERERVLQQYHDVPTAGHYGAEGTYNKVASRYYFPGMRKYIAEYVKNCPDCNRYKPSNQKPTGLLRTPVYAQRCETLAVDLLNEKKTLFYD